MNNTDLGKHGENLATAYFESHGYVVLERNYRRLRCEIDIVAKQGDTLVFAEVKARSGDRYGPGREAVTYTKRGNLVKAAQVYIQEKKQHECNARFDVLEVNLKTDEVHHIINAFQL